MRSKLLSGFVLWLILSAAGSGVGCTEDYDTEIWELNERVDALADDRVAPLDRQVKSLEKAVLDLGSAHDAITKRVDDLKSQTANIDKKLAELREEHSALISEQIAGLEALRAAFSDHVVAYEAMAEEIRNRIEVLETKLKDYATLGDLAALRDDLEVWKQAVADTYATLDQVAQIEARVSVLEQRTDQLFDSVARLNDSIAGVSADLAQAIADFKAADEALRQQSAQNKEEVLAAVESAKNEAIKASGEACEAAFQGRFDAAFLLAFGDAFAAAFDPAFDEAFGAAFDPAFDEAFVAKWSAVKQQMERDFAAYDKALRESIDRAIEQEHGKITAEIAAAIADAVAKIEPRIKALEDALSALTRRVDRLEENIRSMTWIPSTIYQIHDKELLFRGADYIEAPDGEKIFMTNYTDPSSHHTVLKYHIEPQHLAQKITARNISFLVSEISTRAALPQFQITDISATDQGDLELHLYTDYYFSEHEFNDQGRSFALAVKVDMDPENPTSINTFVTDYLGVRVQGGQNVWKSILPVMYKDGSAFIYQGAHELSARDYTTRLKLFADLEVVMRDETTGRLFPIHEVWGNRLIWGLQPLDHNLPDNLLYEPTPSDLLVSDSTREEFYPYVSLVSEDLSTIGNTYYVDYHVAIFPRNEQGEALGIGGKGYRVRDQITITGFDIPLSAAEPVRFPANMSNQQHWDLLLTGDIPQEFVEQLDAAYQANPRGLEFSPDQWSVYGCRVTKPNGEVLPNVMPSGTIAYQMYFSLVDDPSLDTQSQVRLRADFYDWMSFEPDAPFIFSEKGVYTIDIMFRHANYTWSSLELKIEVGDPLPLAFVADATAGDVSSQNLDVKGSVYLECPSRTCSELQIRCLPKAEVAEWVAGHPELSNPYEALLADVQPTKAAQLLAVNDGGRRYELPEALKPLTEYQVLIKVLSMSGEVLYLTEQYFTTAEAVAREPLSLEVSAEAGADPTQEILISIKSPSKTVSELYIMVDEQENWNLAMESQSLEQIMQSASSYPQWVSEVNSDEGITVRYNGAPGTQYVFGIKVVDALGDSVIKTVQIATQAEGSVYGRSPRGVSSHSYEEHKLTLVL